VAGAATHAGAGWAGYFVTGRTNMYTGPFAEHAPNGNGTTFAPVDAGGQASLGLMSRRDGG
jgi:hypothetical protein